MKVFYQYSLDKNVNCARPLQRANQASIIKLRIKEYAMVGGKPYM
jgi:hypothetical protein